MKISIIITSYNYEKFIAQAIESVINQTYSDWELLVVDDGSKDNSVNIIKEYCQKDPRIKLLIHPGGKNKGLNNSLLLGIENAQYDWVVFLESDDYLAQNYLEEKIKFAQNHPNCEFIYNDIEYFGDKKREEASVFYFTKLRKFWEKYEVQDVFDRFGTENIVPTFSCVMCKKSVLASCDFNPVCKPLLDYWIWWQIAEKTPFGFIPKKLTYWRFHPNSYLSKSLKTIRHYIERSMFVYKVTKLFKKEPKLSAQSRFEKNLYLSIPAHLLIYIKRKIPCCIKDLFKTR